MVLSIVFGAFHWSVLGSYSFNKHNIVVTMMNQFQYIIHLSTDAMNIDETLQKIHNDIYETVSSACNPDLSSSAYFMSCQILLALLIM